MMELSFIAKLGLAFYGWFGFNVIVFCTDKDVFDIKNKKFDFKGYKQKSWDNWLASLIVVPIMAAFGPELIEGIANWFFSGVEVVFQTYHYLGTGAVTELFIRWIKKIKNKNNE